MLEICEFVTRMSLAFVYRIVVGAILSFYLTSIILIVTEASLFLELSLALALFDHMSSSMSGLSETIKAMLLTSRHLCTTSSGGQRVI